uniref:Uncharacterized protein n=2 Tax=Phytophthora nicotianae TaxID=4792 RepID=G9CQR9_PHYNI|nr:hypothetical protein [Phytophthora nicotianae]
MIFKIIGITFLILLLFTDIKQIINKIKQFFNKKNKKIQRFF